MTGLRPDEERMTVTIFAVQYTYGGDPQAMDEVRPVHKDFLEGLYKKGTLRVSGPIAPEDGGGALLIIEAEDHDAVARIMDEDPFRRSGFIAERLIRQWNVFFGGFAEVPTQDA